MVGVRVQFGAGGRGGGRSAPPPGALGGRGLEARSDEGQQSLRPLSLLCLGFLVC